MNTEHLDRRPQENVIKIRYKLKFTRKKKNW